MPKLVLPALTLSLAILFPIIARSSGGHDSLAYDGAVWETLLGTTCTVTVLEVNGGASGLLPEMVSDETCGEVETWIEYKVMPLKVGDKVSTDEAITTEEGSSVTVQASDGTIITLGPSTKANLVGACKRGAKNLGLVLQYGEGRIMPQPAPPAGAPAAPPMGIQTNRLSATPKGTVYSVNAGPEGSTSPHVVRVFKGSVEIVPRIDAIQLGMADMGTEADKINDDFAKGRITQAEFTRKMMALSVKMQKQTKGVQTVVTVTAGHECTVDARGIVSKLKKFNARED